MNEAIEFATWLEHGCNGFGGRYWHDNHEQKTHTTEQLYLIWAEEKQTQEQRIAIAKQNNPGQTEVRDQVVKASARK